MESELMIMPEASVGEVTAQVQKIQQVIEAVMKQDEHYGIIPGTKKPTLYKPGAEKLCFTFRLSASYEEVSVQESEEIISYRMRCILTHIPTGSVVGSGMGACNSNEKKYLTRSVATKKATEEEINSAIREEERNGYNNSKYNVLIIPQNPFDLQNTIYKMACKRALLAAVLNATAASDCFAQDLDDIPVNEDNREKPPKESPKRSSEKKKTATKTGDTMLIGIKIDFEDTGKRDVVKAAGFRWNKEDKMWVKDVVKEEFEELKKTLNVEIL